MFYWKLLIICPRYCRDKCLKHSKLSKLSPKLSEFSGSDFEYCKGKSPPSLTYKSVVSNFCIMEISLPKIIASWVIVRLPFLLNKNFIPITNSILISWLTNIVVKLYRLEI